jgi:5-methylcytosine-specific restriction endonuclease McrA
MPYMTNGKRDYKKEDAWDKAHKGRAKERAERMQARRAEVKAGVITKHSKLQIDHIKPLSKGGSNAKSNWRAIPAHQNESYKRNKNGSIKGKRG